MLTLIINLTEPEARAVARAADVMKARTHEDVAHEALRRLLATLGLQTPTGRPLGYRKPMGGRRTQRRST